MIKILIYSDRSSNLLTKRELIWLNDYINKEKRNILSKLIANHTDEISIDWDYVLIHGFNYKNIFFIANKFKESKIILLGGANIGYGNKKDIEQIILKKFVEKYVDLIIVRSECHKQLLEEYISIPIYKFFDYEINFVEAPIRITNQKEVYTIGYHGNEKHFKEDFLCFGEDVLKQISKNHNIQLNIITSNAQYQPNLSNIKVNKIEFEVDNFYNEIDKFDVGICPIYSKELELLNKDKIIRNGNRAVTLLCRGIPSVISPTPQVISDLKDNEHVLYAVSEEEWYEGLNNLLSNSNLYNSISEKGLELVKNKFSVENGYNIFEKIIFDFNINHM